MKDLSFYEQAGIVLPGSVLLLGLLFLVPGLRSPFLEGGLSIGGLGLFLLVAYALGHIVAAGGNVLEWLVWRPVGGMPSDWLVKRRNRLLTPDQIGKVERKLKVRLGIATEISGLSRSAWKRCFYQLYSDVQKNEPAGLVLTYNGNYGLNRGLAVAMIMIAGGCAIRQVPDWEAWSLAFLACAAIYVFRMCRFGVLFAKTVYARFMQLPNIRADRAPKEKADVRKE